MNIDTYTGKLKELSNYLDNRDLGVLIAHIIRVESAWKGDGLSLEDYKKRMAIQLNRRLETCVKRLSKKDKFFSQEKIEERMETLKLQSFLYRYLEFEAYFLKRAFYELFEKRGMSNDMYKEIGDCFLNVTEKEAANKGIHEQYDLLVKKITSLPKK